MLYAAKNYGKFFSHYSIQFIFVISGMEATKINIRSWLFKVQSYRNNNPKWNIKQTLKYFD